MRDEYTPSTTHRVFAFIAALNEVCRDHGLGIETSEAFRPFDIITKEGVRLGIVTAVTDNGVYGLTITED